MTYNCVKKIMLTVILCLWGAGASFAQSNIEGMRFLTINALVQYGRTLYDRGDLNEACAVFNHVLTFDHHQVQALQYLKDMGRSPAPLLDVSPRLISSRHLIGKSIEKSTEGFTEEARVNQPIAHVRYVIRIKKLNEPPNTADVLNTESLKKAIEAKKQAVAKLRAQVVQMRANLASQSAS